MASLAGCGEPPPSATQSATITLVVSLVTPHADDGALILTITGPDLESVVTTPYVAYARATGSGTLRITVVGDLVAGPVVTLRLSVPHDAAAYAGTVEQVAQRTDTLRDALTGYGLTIAPAAP
ncbi:MAG: hypothetical protein DMD62_01185 [Gemmatimonadetes bacterium]|nr:MAG: hypothetical protein DMD62_01185 [Gemmatimonadota bacterium]